MTTPFQPTPGSLVGGKYRLEAPLARGGMGAVWRARHAELGVAVAVKFMDAKYAASPAQRARFAREAKAAAGIRNRHVVDVRDYGLDGEVPYLVMELLQGEDLGSRLSKGRRLSLAETATILAQVAKALKNAHEIGLVHRDLKPANIFLAVADDEEIVKVLDFGIAKDTTSAFGGDTTATGEVIGSPHYMSPEQIRGARDLDARSDVWAMGVVAFRCLTGKVPFDADVVGAIIGQILADPIPVATQVAPDLPRSLDPFFARALSRDRAQRFSSARELAAELSAIAGMPGLHETTVASFARPDIPSVMPITPAPGAGDETSTLVMTPVGSKSAGTLGASVGSAWARSRLPAWAGAVIAMLSLAALGAGYLALRPGSPKEPVAPAAEATQAVAPAPSAAVTQVPLPSVVSAASAEPTVAPLPTVSAVPSVSVAPSARPRSPLTKPPVAAPPAKKAGADKPAPKPVPKKLPALPSEGGF